MKRILVTITAVVMGTIFVGRASVSVTNGGFELPAVAAGGFATSADGWSTTGGGVAANADKFGGTAGGPLPAPGDGRQFAWLNGSNSLYQQVGVIESNRLYTLTVALGRRTDIDCGIAQLALCAGAWNSNEVAMIQGAANVTNGTFNDVSFGFDTYGSLAANAGKALYVRLTHVSVSGQGVYDNVRVTESTNTAFISNADFEFPSVAAGGFVNVPSGWSVYTTNTIGGIVAMADKFGGVAGGPMPAPATGRQAAFLLNGGFLSQEIGVIESNKIYTLTVAVGIRSDMSNGTYTIWFKDGSWNSSTTLVTKTDIAPAPGTFADSSISFSTAKGVNADKIGHRLFLTFGTGSTQCEFDNLRLQLADPPSTYIANPGFEEPVIGNGGWSGTASGWIGSGAANSFGVIAMANEFGGTSGGPMPAPAEGRQSAFISPGAFLYQDVSTIESNRIYALTVAHGRRSSMAAGTGYVWLRDNAWNGANLAAVTNATPPAGTLTNRTVSFATTSNLHADAVGHRLFAVLGATGDQGAFDNVSLSVRRPAGVSLSATPVYTNLATDAVLTVTGPRSSETDNLTTNAATGSVVLSQSVPAPTYVMLWLTGGVTNTYSALAAELSAGGATALTVADNDWIQLAKHFSGFNLLVKFPGQSNTAFNWDFGFGNAWDGAAVDKVAVSTKPTVGTLICVF